MFNKINIFLLKYDLYKKIKFLFAGATTGIIYFSIIFILRDLSGIKNEIPFTISYAVSISYHFLINKFFVFKEKKISSVLSQIPKYALLAVINYFINFGVLKVTKYLSINYYLAVFIGIIITMFLTYFILNKIIFKNK